jgi:hypothetical protein
MAEKDLDKLAALIKQERSALLSNWRQQVRQLPSARHLDVPTLNDHLPGLIDELAAALRKSPTSRFRKHSAKAARQPTDYNDSRTHSILKKW